MIGSKKKFIGSFDGFKDGVVRGWVKLVKSNSDRLTVDVICEGRLLKSITSDMYREDLEKAGLGDGCYAFETHIGHDSFEFLGEQERGKLVLKVGELGLLGEVDIRFGQKFEMNKRELAALKLEFDSFFRISAGAASTYCPDLSYVDDNVLVNEKKDIAGSRFEGVFPQELGVSPISSKFSPKPDVSPYIKFSRDKMKVDNQYLVDVNPQDIDGLLFWYLESYGNHRKPRKVPLSSDEVAYLNDLVGISGYQLKLTRYHMMHFLRNTSDFDYKGVLSDMYQYRSVIYEWVTGYCLDFNLDDCLVPEHYIDVLRTILPEHRTEKYPFNYFMQHHFNLRTDLHESDASTTEGRRTVYLRVILRFIDKPSLFRLIPDIVIDELLKNGDVNKLTECASDVLGEDYLDEKQKCMLTYEGVTKTLLSQGYNHAGKYFTTFDKSGNRLEALKYKSITTSASSDVYDVQIIGPFEKASGLGQAARLAADILERSGLNINRVNFGLDNPAPEGFSSEQRHGKLSPAKINLIHLNAESYPMAIAYLPDAFTDSYNIGYFYWELNSPAKCHSLGMELVDEVWVATEYGVEQYAPHMPKGQPVTNVGMAVEDFVSPKKDESRAYIEDNYGVEKGTTVYLAAFDSFSFVQRKNPAAVVKAFLDAFQSDESVHLILKTQNRDFVGDPNQLRIWDEVIRLTGDDDRVTIINKTLKYTDLLKLKRGSDCYITLHRSEGWGFGMIEAMALGLPVIATGYSGNLEFCKAENSWLVDYEESYLGPEDYIFVIPGQKWAKPNHGSAVAALRESYDSPELRVQKSIAAQKFVEENFSMDAIAKRFRDRVDVILKENLN